jgi:hypothetical protein
LSLVAASGAHSIWIESTPGGLRAYFGEAEAGERDTLRPAQNFDRLEAWNSDGSRIATKVGTDHVDLGRPENTVLAIHRSMPVHGEGKDAGRAVFLARHAGGDAQVVPKPSNEVLDILPASEGPGVALVLRDGKPAPGQKVSLLGPGGRSTETQADSLGRIGLPAEKGRWLLSAWVEVAGKGRHLGKDYARTWHVATLAWERP